MLCLSRKRNESVILDLREFGLGLVKILTVDIRGEKTRVGVDADVKIPVHREEVFNAIERSRKPGT